MLSEQPAVPYKNNPIWDKILKKYKGPLSKSKFLGPFNLQGIAYIKFYKTSEAALAMEEMNGKAVGTDPRPLKVLIAHAKDQVTYFLQL